MKLNDILNQIIEEECLDEESFEGRQFKQTATKLKACFEAIDKSLEDIVKNWNQYNDALVLCNMRNKYKDNDDIDRVIKSMAVLKEWATKTTRNPKAPIFQCSGILDQLIKYSSDF